MIVRFLLAPVLLMVVVAILALAVNLPVVGIILVVALWGVVAVLYTRNLRHR